MWRCGELYFIAQALDALRITSGLLPTLTEHFAGFVLVTAAGSFLFDLFDVATRPDLRFLDAPSCNPDSPMLPLGEDK